MNSFINLLNFQQNLFLIYCYSDRKRISNYRKIQNHLSVSNIFNSQLIGFLRTNKTNQNGGIVSEPNQKTVYYKVTNHILLKILRHLSLAHSRQHSWQKGFDFRLHKQQLIANRNERKEHFSISVLQSKLFSSSNILFFSPFSFTLLSKTIIKNMYNFL